MKQSDNEFVFDQKFKISDEESLPDSKSSGTKDLNVFIPNFNNLNVNSNGIYYSHRLSCSVLVYPRPPNGPLLLL